MRGQSKSTFTIIRTNQAVGPKTVVAEGLLIGRDPDSDVWLNHASISRLHAGINEIEGYFYVINLSPARLTTLNGRAVPFNEAEALTSGDEIQVGPFFLKVTVAGKTLSLRVELESAVSAGEGESRRPGELFKQENYINRQTRKPVARPPQIADALKIFWGNRIREKAARPSPLHPQTPLGPGKIRFKWQGTRDLVRPWPLALFLWALIVIGSLSAVAAVRYKTAFAPAAISNPHTRTTLALTPPIAKQANANSCSSCHSLGISITNREKMNANCAACHETESFGPTMIRAHRDAGISCTSCHAEHGGENFSPMQAALDSCTKCHNDSNKQLYKGKSVHTPHGGTFGYPSEDRVWIWKGLDEEELASKPEVAAFIKKNRVTASQVQEWRNAQFHGIHVGRVRVVEGIDGSLAEDGVTKVLSCSSCHKTGYMGANVDRSFPRTTCERCHNGKVFYERVTDATNNEGPGCTSCHVQHLKDAHWAPALRFAANENR